MKSPLVALAFGACAAIVIGMMAMAGRPPKKVPDKYEPFGDFEIVTRTQRYRTGWNEGRLGWASPAGRGRSVANVVDRSPGTIG